MAQEEAAGEELDSSAKQNSMILRSTAERNEGGRCERKGCECEASR